MFALLLPPALSLLAGSAPSPAAPRAGRGARMAGGDVPSIIVGGGRIGSALKELGVEGDVVLRRGDAFPAAPASGPIYVTTRNDDLAGVVAATPPERRQDLVFVQNGMLGEFLEELGLSDATQVLLYLAVAKLGEPPIDGITDTNPDGLTTANGRWAEAFRARLAGGGLTCHVKQGEEYTKAMLEKHVWICAFMVTGALHGGVTVGEVESAHAGQLRALVDELCAAGEAALGVRLEPGAFERLAAYGRSVAHFPTAVKEFEWRNGWFHKISQRALAEGRPDPLPLHTAALQELGVVKEGAAQRGGGNA